MISAFASIIFTIYDLYIELKSKKEVKRLGAQEVGQPRHRTIEDAERERAELERLAMLKEKARGYEVAMNFPQASATYEELGMWEDARRCREFASGAQANIPPPPPPRKILAEEKTFIQDEVLEKLLSDSVMMYVPTFIDTGTAAEIVVEIDNRSQHTLENLSLDFSELHDFFEVEGEVRYSALKPGIKLVNRVKIKARKGIEGVIPVSIGIEGNRARVRKEYSIKVGGTEIY